MNEKIIPTQAVSIVMPVCNEADIIEQVIQEWYENVIQFLPTGSELLFDEAGSTDETKSILERLSQQHSFIRVIYNDHRDGFGNSAKRLYRESKCPLTFFTDSDGQYVPSEFWKLTPFISDFDIVHGAKISRKDPLYRKIASVIFNGISKILFNSKNLRLQGPNYPVQLLDINSAFRIVKRPVIDVILPKLKHLPTLVNAEFLIRLRLENFQIKQVQVEHRPRSHGQSRALPSYLFFWECIQAFRGLLSLRKEYRCKD